LSMVKFYPRRAKQNWNRKVTVRFPGTGRNIFLLALSPTRTTTRTRSTKAASTSWRV
jgi:hypothetical protein